ncbi:MAG: hypothetical protein LBO20_06550, partial [Bifidobacteriaceae bacterium]|nr:hypothetical protein [Bifidobacteriaceae bacterium]
MTTGTPKTDPPASAEADSPGSLTAQMETGRTQIDAATGGGGRSGRSGGRGFAAIGRHLLR